MQILKLRLKSLYPGHKVSSREVAFDFLDAYSINLEKELAKILEDRKSLKIAEIDNLSTL